MIAPPKPPSHDPLEALIREARSRQRRRWAIIAAAVLAIAGVGVALWAARPGGGTATVRGHGPITGAVGQVSNGSAFRRIGVGEVGSSGGVTWVMNGRGLWLTSDGGRVWRKVAVPQGTGFIEQHASHVQFVDSRHGWMSITELTGWAPDRGRRWIFARTTDGGRTWHTSYPPDCHGLCGGGSMSFLDARNGYLLAYEPGVGTPNELLRTDDGGQTWQPVAKAPINGPITFLDDRTGFAFGWGDRGIIGPYSGPPFGTLYRTTDGGHTWSRYDIGGSKSFVQQPVRVVGHRLVVVQNRPNPPGGVHLAAGTIYVSDDGRNWTGSAVPGEPTVLTSFTAVSPDVWRFSSVRDLYTTADAGRHWQRIRLRGVVAQRPQRFWLENVDFTSSQAGWFVFRRNLYGTTDGGLHWTLAGPAKGKPIPLQPCNPDQLTIRFWSTAGALRHANGNLQFTNRGRLGCTVAGWPTVVAIKANGSMIQARRISPASARGLNWPRSRPVKRVVVGPGGSAYAELEGADVHGRDCPIVFQVKVTPPGGHRSTPLLGPWSRRGTHPVYFPLCSGIAVTSFVPRSALGG